MLLICFIVVLAALVAWVGLEEVGSLLATLTVSQVIVLLGLSGAHYFLRAFRWHLMVRFAGIGTGFGSNALHFFGGFALTATPGRLGEIVRIRWLSRETGLGYGHLVPVAVADRLNELAAIVLVIGVSLAAAGIASFAAWWVVGFATVMIGCGCRPSFLKTCVDLIERLFGRLQVRWGRRAIVRLRAMVGHLEPLLRIRVAVPSLALGVVGWTIEGAAFWLILLWLDAGVGFATATAIFLVAVLSGTLSGLPGGLGGTEATAVSLLLMQGCTADTALIATVLIRITTLWFAVGIGFVAFPFAEIRAALNERMRTA